MNSAIHWQQKRWCKSSKGLIGMAIVPARKIRIPIDQNLDNQIWGLHFAARSLETLRYELTSKVQWHWKFMTNTIRTLTHRHLILQDSWCQSYVTDGHKLYKGLYKHLMKCDHYNQGYICQNKELAHNICKIQIQNEPIFSV